MVADRRDVRFFCAGAFAGFNGVEESGKQVPVNRDGFHFRQTEPLVGKVRNKIVRAWVGEHPANLLGEYRGIVEVATRRKFKEPHVRHAAPQEVGECGGKFEVMADDFAVGFRVQQKLRCHQHHREGFAQGGLDGT